MLSPERRMSEILNRAGTALPTLRRPGRSGQATLGPGDGSCGQAHGRAVRESALRRGASVPLGHRDLKRKRKLGRVRSTSAPRRAGARPTTGDGTTPAANASGPRAWSARRQSRTFPSPVAEASSGVPTASVSCWEAVDATGQGSLTIPWSQSTFRPTTPDRSHPTPAPDPKGR